MDDYSNYADTTTTNISDENAAALAAIMLFVSLIAILFILAIYIFCSIALMKIFKKAGIEQWIAWVPIYNSWKMLEMGKLPGALVLLSLIPFVGALIVFVVSTIAAFRIGRGFGRSDAFILLWIFLSPAWLAVLGFGKSEWNESKAV